MTAVYVTIEPQDACATCKKPTPKTVSMDAVGWVVELCPQEPSKAIAWVAGYPLLCAYCPDCAHIIEE